MLLAIDAGNTNTTFAVFDGEEIVGEWRAGTNTARTADEYAVWLSSLMQLVNLKFANVDTAIIATVVPQGLFNLRTLCRRYFNCEPLVVGDPDVDIGIRILIEKERDVGADRLVNAVAAHHAYGGPAIILDFGTATTFDVIDENGNYHGGVIAPGINLSLEALHMAAAKLPRIAVERPTRVIGNDTQSAMLSGVYYGYVGLIEGLVARIKQDFGKPMKVVATGGLAAMFDDGTDEIDMIDRDLTMKGLLMIARRNPRTMN
ncbi:type III pantothenate kinase [Minwuia thermotolerans]|uniref:Type III pantothenate kinase n=1 Tax=Minwuia thermotolerans TaxID=2056226 RepID=A0A2M9G1P5_9PROT|nr:type III pantothenate kinase [Minwuia thermotolerans]PJK29640.1 pantothenate kinase [Minwuia thermotolerans]